MDRNLRQGHRAELEGIDFLRPFCAVAQVPQTEDIGFDAVATLLRTDGRYYYAEDSFCVQLKARSVREIKLEPHEYKWFHALSMPLFIASVDIESKDVELFTTHSMAAHLNTKDFNSAVMYLDRIKSSFDGDCMKFWLGEPVLKWTAHLAEDPNFQSLAYTVLKQWSTTEYANIGLRRIRAKQQVWTWKTNEPPEQGKYSAMAGPDELDQDLGAAVPYLMKIASHLFSQDKTKVVPLELLGFYLLSNWIHSRNVPDAKALVQMSEHKLGVFDEGFSLELKIDTKTTTQSDKQSE